MRALLLRAIRRFPKGTIWQTRYICLPTAIVLSTLALADARLSLGTRVSWFLLGVATWSLAEYLLHRFGLHYTARGAVARAFMERMHTAHHQDPKDDTQVCMPFVFLAPLWTAILFAIWLLGGGTLASVLYMSGFGLMIVVYDITHYSVHFMKSTNWLLRGLTRHHMLHHCQNDRLRFGVTSPVWDWVFGTARERTE